MTVRELVEKLSSLPPDLVVIRSDSDDSVLLAHVEVAEEESWWDGIMRKWPENPPVAQCVRLT